MKNRSVAGWMLGTLTLGLAPTGCAALLGLDEFSESAATTGTGGSGGGATSSGTTATTGATGGGTGTSSGTGGAAPCMPNVSEPCYEAPVATKDVGLCKGGTHICNADGLSWGACSAQVLPDVESCANSADENCDSSDCGEWASVFGSGGELSAVDKQGNIYVVGAFFGNAVFGPDALLSAGGTDIFLNGPLISQKTWPSLES